MAGSRKAVYDSFISERDIEMIADLGRNEVGIEPTVVVQSGLISLGYPRESTQAEHTEMTGRYERDFYLSVHGERALMMLPLNTLMAARVKGEIEGSELRSAVERLRRRHALLAVRFVLGDAGATRTPSFARKATLILWLPDTMRSPTESR